jgi:hypothetical protein
MRRAPISWACLAILAVLDPTAQASPIRLTVAGNIGDLGIDSSALKLPDGSRGTSGLGGFIDARSLRREAYWEPVPMAPRERPPGLQAIHSIRPRRFPPPDHIRGRGELLPG